MGADDLPADGGPELDTITAINDFLRERRSPVQITLINTRVLLETGVNLQGVCPDQDHDRATVEKVASVLDEMGVLSH